MEVDRKHITTIRLHDAKGGDIRLVKDGTDYQLKMTSDDTEVNIRLGYQDVCKLCREIVQVDVQEHWSTRYMLPLPPEPTSFFGTGARRIMQHQEAISEWVANMAKGSWETTGAYR